MFDFRLYAVNGGAGVGFLLNVTFGGTAVLLVLVTNVVASLTWLLLRPRQKLRQLWDLNVMSLLLFLLLESSRRWRLRRLMMPR